MADETIRTTVDPALDGALERFERAEAELEETDARRQRLADEAARAASELESVLGESIDKAISTRDRLEDELAVVTDHISRLEAMRARSERTSGAPTVQTVGAGAEDQWDRLLRSRDEDEPIHLVSEDLSTDR
jgi:hypothetical protein